MFEKSAHHCATPLQHLPWVYFVSSFHWTYHNIQASYCYVAAKGWASVWSLKWHRALAENHHHQEGVRRLPGSSEGPVDHRCWQGRQGNIQLSSQSSPTLRDMIPSLYWRGRVREAAAPSPLLRWAPRESQTLQPLPDHMTVPQREHCGPRHYQAPSCGSQRDWECPKGPNGWWSPRVHPLSLN